MSNYPKIEFRDSFIHVQHSSGDEITTGCQSQLWTEIAEASKRHNCRKVLSESPSPPFRKMGTLDAINLAKHTTNVAPGLSVACCYTGYTPDDTDEFFKTAAINRGMRIEFFGNRKDAMMWLGIYHAD